MRVPLQDVMTLNARKPATVVLQRFEVFETRPGRRNGKLRVERQQNQLLNAVPIDLFNRLLGERSRIRHPDISVRFNATSRKFFPQGRGLLLRDSPQGRSAADLRVVARRLFVSSRRDQPCQRLLHCANRQPHDLRVGEQIEEEWAHVGQCFRPAEIEEQYAEFHRRVGEWESGRAGERETEESFSLSPALPLSHSPLLRLFRQSPSSPLRDECISGWLRPPPTL